MVLLLKLEGCTCMYVRICTYLYFWPSLVSICYCCLCEVSDVNGFVRLAKWAHSFVCPLGASEGAGERERERGREGTVPLALMQECACITDYVIFLHMYVHACHLPLLLCVIMHNKENWPFFILSFPCSSEMTVYLLERSVMGGSRCLLAGDVYMFLQKNMVWKSIPPLPLSLSLAPSLFSLSLSPSLSSKNIKFLLTIRLSSRRLVCPTSIRELASVMRIFDFTFSSHQLVSSVSCNRIENKNNQCMHDFVEIRFVKFLVVLCACA